MEQGPGIRSIKVEQIFAVEQQPHDIFMRNQRSLRLACRSGCIDDISQIRRLVDRWRIGSFPAVCLPVIKEQHLARKFHLLPQMFWQQQNVGPGIGQHVTDAVFRILRIDRHISASGLENGEKPYKHVCCALGHDANQLVGPDSFRSQRPSQTVGLLVQLPIRHDSIRCRYRNRFWCPVNLFLEQAVNRLVSRIVCRCIIELFKQLMFLRFCYDAELLQTQVRIINDGFQHLTQMSGHPLNRITLVQGRCIFNTAYQALFAFFNVQGEIKFGNVMLNRIRLHGKPVDGPLTFFRILQYKHGIEYRIAAYIPRWLNMVN